MRIAIDLTPLLPGGDNGGAKIMTLQLVRHLALLQPTSTFLLFVNNRNQAELASYQSANTKLINTSLLHTVEALLHLKKQGFRGLILKLIRPLLKIVQQYYARKMKADLLFCPFTAPYYHKLITPVISVVYDLQSHYLTSHFTQKESDERKKNFNDACQNSDTLICISDFVRQTVIENSEVNPDDIKTIYIRLAHRLPHVSDKKQSGYLEAHHLIKNGFLLYPANFWPHKNHKMLFAAFSLFCKQNPFSTLKLVCTGTSNEAQKQILLQAAHELGLSNRLYLPGFISDETFASFMLGSRALIFPSLYEGFGMPTLEAMAHNKPVLCSNVTSLPEIVGSAAILFDPYSVTDMAAAIHLIEYEPSLVDQLVEYGKERVAAFGSEVDMAKEYLQVFKDVLLKNTQKTYQG